MSVRTQLPAYCSGTLLGRRLIQITANHRNRLSSSWVICVVTNMAILHVFVYEFTYMKLANAIPYFCDILNFTQFLYLIGSEKGDKNSIKPPLIQNIYLFLYYWSNYLFVALCGSVLPCLKFFSKMSIWLSKFVIWNCVYLHFSWKIDYNLPTISAYIQI